MQLIKSKLLALLLLLLVAPPLHAQLVKIRIAQPNPPIISWTGTTSGSQNMVADGTLDFGPGTYTLTCNRALTTTFKGAGGGQKGHSNSGDLGGNGGRGADTTTGTSTSCLVGKTYTLVVGAAGTIAPPATGNTTTFTNTTDAIVIVRLPGGATGDAFVGSNQVAGGLAGSGGINAGVGAATPGGNATNGAAGGGGGGFYDSGGGTGNPGANGGNGSNAGQAGGAGTGAIGGVGGNGGGASFLEHAGNFGFGGGGAGGRAGGGQNGGAGVAVFIFVSAP